MSRADEMRELMARWKASGMTQRAFAEKEGVTYSRFQYWRRRLGGKASGKPAKRAPPVHLDPVRIVPDPSVATSVFELRTARGLSIGVPAGFDEGELRRLLDVIAAC